MRRKFWIFGALAAFSIAAVSVMAQTAPAPNSADDDDSDDVMMGMPGMGMGMRGGMGAGICPLGAGMGMGARGGKAMMGSRGSRGVGAGCGSGMGAGMAGRGMGLMRLQALNLTSEQWTRVRQIQQDFQKQIIPKQGEMRVIQIDLQQLLQATQPNMNQVQAKLTAIGNLRTQVQVLRTQEFVQVRGVLTADQLTKFLDPSWTPPCMMPGMQQPMAPMPGRAPGAGHGPMMNR